MYLPCFSHHRHRRFVFLLDKDGTFTGKIEVPEIQQAVQESEPGARGTEFGASETDRFLFVQNRNYWNISVRNMELFTRSRGLNKLPQADNFKEVFRGKLNVDQNRLDFHHLTMQQVGNLIQAGITDSIEGGRSLGARMFNKAQKGNIDFSTRMREFMLKIPKNPSNLGEMTKSLGKVGISLFSQYRNVQLPSDDFEIDFSQSYFSTELPTTCLERVLADAKQKFLQHNLTETDFQAEKMRIQDEIIAHPAWRAYSLIVTEYMRVYSQADNTVQNASPAKIESLKGRTLEQWLKKYVPQISYEDHRRYLTILRRMIDSHASKFLGKANNIELKGRSLNGDFLADLEAFYQGAEGIPSDDVQRGKLNEGINTLKDLIDQLIKLRNKYHFAFEKLKSAKIEKQRSYQTYMQALNTPGTPQNVIIELSNRYQAFLTQEATSLDEIRDAQSTYPVTLNNFTSELRDIRIKDVSAEIFRTILGQAPYQQIIQANPDAQKQSDALVVAMTRELEITGNLPDDQNPAHAIDDRNDSTVGFLNGALGISNKWAKNLSRFKEGQTKIADLQPNMTMEAFMLQVEKYHLTVERAADGLPPYDLMPLHGVSGMRMIDQICEEDIQQKLAHYKTTENAQLEMEKGLFGYLKHAARTFVKRVYPFGNLAGPQENTMQFSVSVSNLLQTAFSFANIDTDKISNPLFYRRLSVQGWQGIGDFVQSGSMRDIINLLVLGKEKGGIDRAQAYELFYRLTERKLADSFSRYKAVEVFRFAENLRRALAYVEKDVLWNRLKSVEEPDEYNNTVQDLLTTLEMERKSGDQLAAKSHTEFQQKLSKNTVRGRVGSALKYLRDKSVEVGAKIKDTVWDKGILDGVGKKFLHETVWKKGFVGGKDKVSELAKEAAAKSWSYTKTGAELIKRVALGVIGITTLFSFFGLRVGISLVLLLADTLRGKTYKQEKLIKRFAKWATFNNNGIINKVRFGELA